MTKQLIRLHVNSFQEVTANFFNMKLIAKQKAPNFNMDNCFGGKINLKDYKGKRILLSFFRNSTCPFCSMRVLELSKHYEKFKAQNWELILVFESKKKIIERSSLHSSVKPIPLISDPEKELYRMYGLEPSAIAMLRTHLSKEMRKIKSEAKEIGIIPKEQEKGVTMNMMPANFIISPETQTIERAYYGKMAGDHIPIKELLH